MMFMLISVTAQWLPTEQFFVCYVSAGKFAYSLWGSLYPKPKARWRKSLSSCRFNYLLRWLLGVWVLGKLRIWQCQPIYPRYIHHQICQMCQKFDLKIIDNQILQLFEEIPQDLIPDNYILKGEQKNWDLPRTKSKFLEMFDSSESTARARLLASSTKESSKWLQVVPSSQLGLLLDNNSARIAVGLYLGCHLCAKHKCICGVLVKKDGLHGLSRKKTAGWISAHDEVNKIVSHAFSSAGYPNIIQSPGISRDDGKRPDGMTIIPWSRGRPILWDVTIRDTLAPSYFNESSKNSGSERFKHNHYIILKENYLFTPIAFESLGSMGPETKIFRKQLGSLMRKASGETRSMDYLLQLHI